MERLLPVQELIPPGLPEVVYPTAPNHTHQDDNDANGYWVAGDYVYQGCGGERGEGEEGNVGGGGGGPDTDPSLSSTWSHPHLPVQSLDEQHGHNAWSAPHKQNQMDDGSGYASIDVGYDDQDQAGYVYNPIGYANTDPQLYYVQFHSPTLHSQQPYHAGGHYTQSQSPALSLRTDPQFSAVPSPSPSLVISPQQYQSHSEYPPQQQQEQGWYTKSPPMGMPTGTDYSAYTHGVPKLEDFTSWEPMVGGYYPPQSQSPESPHSDRSQQRQQQASSFYDPAPSIVPSSVPCSTTPVVPCSTSNPSNSDPSFVAADAGDISFYFASVNTQLRARPLPLLATLASPSFQEDIQGHSHYVDPAHPGTSMPTQPAQYASSVTAVQSQTQTQMPMGTNISRPITLSPSSELSGALDESAIWSGGGYGRAQIPGPGPGRGKAPEVGSGSKVEGRSVGTTTSSTAGSAPTGTTLFTTLPLDGLSSHFTATSTSTSTSHPTTQPKPKKEGQGRKKSKSKSKIPEQRPTPVMDCLQPSGWEHDGSDDQDDGSGESGGEDGHEEEDDEGREDESGEGERGRTAKDMDMDRSKSGRSSTGVEGSLPPSSTQAASDRACIACLIPSTSPVGSSSTPAMVQPQAPYVYQDHNRYPHPPPPLPPNPLMQTLGYPLPPTISQQQSPRPPASSQQQQSPPQPMVQQTVQQQEESKKTQQQKPQQDKKKTTQPPYPHAHAQVTPPSPALWRRPVFGPLSTTSPSTSGSASRVAEASAAGSTGPIFAPAPPPTSASAFKSAPAPAPPLTSTSTLTTSPPSTKPRKPPLKSRPTPSLTSAPSTSPNRNTLAPGGSGGGMLFVQDEAAFRPTKPKPLPKAQREKEREKERAKEKAKAKKLAVGTTLGSGSGSAEGSSSAISPAMPHGRSHSRPGGTMVLGAGGAGGGSWTDAPWTTTPLPVSPSVTVSSSQSRMQTPTASGPSFTSGSGPGSGSAPVSSFAQSTPNTNQGVSSHSNPYPPTQVQTNPQLCIPLPPPPPAPYHPGSAYYIPPVSRLKPSKCAPRAQTQTQAQAGHYHNESASRSTSGGGGGICVSGGSGSGVTGVTGASTGAAGAGAGPAGRAKRKARPALACLFCRMRKIACGPPLPGSGDMTCNQCARRSRKCEYPTESRRGQHKRKKHSRSTGTPVVPSNLGVSTSTMSMSVGVTGDGGTRTMVMEDIKMEGGAEGMSGIMEGGSVQAGREREAMDIDDRDVDMQDEQDGEGE